MKSGRSYLRIPVVYIAVLLAGCTVLGVLHYFHHDLRSGGIYWFNLDKERNLPTWFSGILFFLFGLISLAAFGLEKQQNSSGAGFNNPYLWLFTACTGFAMSLDETTILHENLYWREVRQFSSALGTFSYYVTQWQILFAPFVIVIISYFILLFLNRFTLSKLSLLLSFSAIASWLIAFLLEGLRESFRALGPNNYLMEVVVEEELEMVGAVLLTGAVALYLSKIHCGLSESERRKLKAPLITKKALLTLCAFGVLCLFIGGLYYYFASELARRGAPVPRLMQKVLRGAI